MPKQGSFVDGMRHFKEWAAIVAMSKREPELVIPVRHRNQDRLAFSLAGYNYFVEHSVGRLPKARSEKDLTSRIRKYKRYLYTGESALKGRKSGFFLVPNKI